MSKKTVLLILLLLIITSGLLYLALKPAANAPSSAPPATVKKVIPIVPAETTLAILPSPLTLSSSSGSLNVNIDTQKNNVTGVQLEISYDPKVVTKITPKPGSFFPNALAIINENDVKNGRVTYALGLSPTAEPVIGKGTVVVLDIEVNYYGAVKSTEIKLLPKSLVTARNTVSSVLKKGVGATINFGAKASPTSY